MATKKAPSRKQLAARKKFVKMVRARAKALKAAKRAIGTKARRAPAKRVTRRAPAKRRNTMKRKAPSVSVMKAGRRLFGAAAAAVLAKQGAKKRNPRVVVKVKANGKRRSTLLTGRKRNGVFRTAARRAIARRLSAPIRFGRRRNSGVPSNIQAVHKMFLGRESTKAFNVTAPSDTPKDVAVLGPLVCLKTKDETFEFGRGEAWLATDGQAKKLYILGDKYATALDPNANYGPITEVRYEARKDHINPFRFRKRRRNASVTEYFHFFGEEDGRRPHLRSDRDRLLHISGGNFKIRAEGIVN